MVFTSKTLIPGKQPIGQNRDGSYIYDGEPVSAMPSQNMSMMPKKPVTPITTQSTGIPNVGIPGVKGLTTPIAPTTSSKLPPVTFSPERAKAINAPVNDVKGILQVDKTQPRVQQLEQHFRTLKEKGELQLNSKQSEYIKRYKKNLPEYANVPDAILYGRIIIKYPEAMEKYGNIGEKGFLERLYNLPYDIAKAGGEGVNEAIEKGQERKAILGEDSTTRKALGFLGVPKSSTITDIATAGRVVGNVAMGTLGSVLNLASPAINPDKNVTSITEGLQRDVGTAVESIPEPVRNEIAQLIEKHPIISTYIGQGLDIANLVPLLGPLRAAKTTGQVDDILKQVKARPATRFRGEVSPEVYKVGTERSLIRDTASIPGKTVKAVTPDIIKKDVATLRAERIEKGLKTQNNNLKSVGKSYKNNTKVYTLDDGTKQTVTPIDTFKKYGIEPEIDEKTIRMGDYKTTREGELGKIQDNIEAISDEMDTVLKDTGIKVKLSEMKAMAQNVIKNDPELKQAGKVSSTLKKLEDRFDDYQVSYGDELDITEVNNIRKTANKDWSPDTQDISSIVGDVGRDIVYNSTDDMYVRDLLREQGNLLAARKYAISLDGTKVRGGRLGDLVSGGAGAAVGAVAGMTIPVPIVGPAIGAAVGQKVGTSLSKLFSSTQFKSPLTQLKGVFSKSGGDVSPSIKVQRVPKASTKSIELPKATSQKSSGNLSSPTKSVSNVQKLLPETKKLQIESGKSSVLSQVSKGKEKSASSKVNTPIIQKIAKKQETPNSKRALPMSQKSDVVKTVKKDLTGEKKNDTLGKNKYLPMSQKSDVVYSKPVPKSTSKNGLRNIFEKDGFTISEPRKGRYGTSYTGGVRMETVKKGYQVGKKWKEEATGFVNIYPEKQYHVTGSKDVHTMDEIIKALDDKGIQYTTRKDWETGAIKSVTVDLNNLTKAETKSALPMSSRTPVKYGKVDDLVSEARKYKSAEEFIKAQEGNMYFHGTNVDFKKPDVSKVGTGEGSIMAGKGFNLTSLSSDAKNYAYQVSQKKGGKEVILGTKIDKNKMKLFDADKMDKDIKMQSEIIDFILKKQNEFKGLTKDKIIEKLDDKWTGDFMGLIEEEYGFAKYVDDFIKSKGYDGVITKERTSQKWGNIRPENITIFNPKDIEMVNLLDIYNKANK